MEDAHEYFRPPLGLKSPPRREHVGQKFAQILADRPRLFRSSQANAVGSCATEDRGGTKGEMGEGEGGEGSGLTSFSYLVD